MEVVERAFALVERLARSRDGKTLSELARATNLPPPTVHRLLSSLAEAGIVERDELSKRWRPGLRFVRIAVALNGSAGGADIAADKLLRQLHDRWTECFFIVVLAEDQAVCVRSVETTESHRITVSVPLGRRLAMHASASAKAILADLPATEARRLLKAGRLQSFTDKTLTSMDAVMADLRSTHERGYAVCDEEVEMGVLAYAVPIRGASDGPPRSLGVIGPRERLLAEADEGLLDDMASMAAELATLPRG